MGDINRRREPKKKLKTLKVPPERVGPNNDLQNTTFEPHEGMYLDKKEIKKQNMAKLKKRIAKQLLGVEFGTLGPDGKVTNKGSIDLDKIDSDDPIAYSMGYSEGAQNTKINPKGVETSPGVYDDYAPEYKRGWSEGNLFFKKH